MQWGGVGGVGGGVGGGVSGCNTGNVILMYVSQADYCTLVTSGINIY